MHRALGSMYSMRRIADRVSRGRRRRIDSGPSVPFDDVSGAYRRVSVFDESCVSTVAARLRDELEPPSPGGHGVNARGVTTSVRTSVGGGFDGALVIGAVGVGVDDGGEMAGALRRSSIVAARVRGLAGRAEASVGVFSGEVGGMTENTNCLLVKGVAGADSVDDAGRAMCSTD